MTLFDCKKGTVYEIVEVKINNTSLKKHLENLGIKKWETLAICFESFKRKALLVCVAGGDVAIDEKICKQIEVKKA